MPHPLNAELGRLVGELEHVTDELEVIVLERTELLHSVAGLLDAIAAGVTFERCDGGLPGVCARCARRIREVLAHRRSH